MVIISRKILTNINEDILNKAVIDIETASLETGVHVDGLDCIKNCKRTTLVNERTCENNENAVFCRYPWNGILSLLNDGTHRYFCCYMAEDDTARLKKQYEIPNGKTLDDMYNCSSYWVLRKDMLEGKLVDCCKGCKFADAGYNILKNKEIDVNERCYF